jgi:hypothetical protein
MYEAEQAQLGPEWQYLDLEEEVRYATELDPKVFPPTRFPTCVLVLVDTEEGKKAALSRLRTFRWHVNNGHEDFALGNQPQYVRDLVMATEIPEGWTPYTTKED